MFRNTSFHSKLFQFMNPGAPDVPKGRILRRIGSGHFTMKIFVGLIDRIPNLVSTRRCCHWSQFFLVEFFISSRPRKNNYFFLVEISINKNQLIFHVRVFSDFAVTVVPIDQHSLQGPEKHCSFFYSFAAKSFRIQFKGHWFHHVCYPAINLIKKH